jgi:hypothetical protein
MFPRLEIHGAFKARNNDVAAIVERIEKEHVIDFFANHAKRIKQLRVRP